MASLRFHLLLVVLFSCLTGCSQPWPQSLESSVTPVDADATPPTRALLNNLHAVRHKGFLFGHQDTLAYGVNWIGEDDQSDIKKITGDYPALYGWDLGNLELGDSANLDGVDFARMQEWIKQAYGRGGVITISWHMNHPLTGGNSWQTEPGAAPLLPGGAGHAELKANLDRFAAFVRQLEVVAPNGGKTLVPIIFRPWHEHNGDWFWWGKGHTSADDYVALWRFTVDYLREQKDLHSLLYAFAPDRSRIDMGSFRNDYLYAYPGDDYVDILGMDNYWDLGHQGNSTSPSQSRHQFNQSLTELVRLAEEKNKLPAMTEGGQETVPDAHFFTETLLSGILANPTSSRIAYVQLWRNANREKENRDHFYVPYPGHPAAEDFLEFYRHPATLFGSDLPDMYL